LGESGKDDQDEFKTIHPLSANDVGQPTETKLPKDGTTGCGNLDRCIGVGWNNPRVFLVGLPVDDAQHGSHQVDGEDVIGISEETNTGYDNSTNVVPAKWGLIDLGQGESTALVGVDDVSEVIMEVVESGIAALCFQSHGKWWSLVGVMQVRGSLVK
jgi:hypothetical protein